MLLNDLLGPPTISDNLLRRISSESADHFRAIPLSDGYHILFTDPRTGYLCLGTDAPVGSLTRLLRKVWFRPPHGAISPVPILYTAGADIRHGVRVVATYAIHRGNQLEQEVFSRDHHSMSEPANSCLNRQIVVFYTVPPDVFHNMTRTNPIPQTFEHAFADGREQWLHRSALWHTEHNNGVLDLLGDPIRNSPAYPFEISGQPVAVCSNLTELALDSSPDMIIWAFSVEGWARTWAIEDGRFDPFMKTAVQRDGSLRRIDLDGDLLMPDAPLDSAPADVSVGDLDLFDGAAGSAPYGSVANSYWDGSERLAELLRLRNPIHIDFVEEMDRITRVDLEI